MDIKVKWPKEIIKGRLDKIVINVKPTFNCPGRNIEVLKQLFVKIGIAEDRSEEIPAEWGGRNALLCHNDIFIRILDYSPSTTSSWGGPSDNMLTVRFFGKTAQEGAMWLVNFFKLNNYNSNAEIVSDGTYDVFVFSMFVSFKFNVCDGTDFIDRTEGSPLVKVFHW